MGRRFSYQLMSNAAAAGNSAPVVISQSGTYSYAVNGTFAGTTAKLQMLGPDGANYIDVPGVSHTAAGAVSVDLPAGATVRSVMTAGTPTAMYATLSLIR